MLDLGGREADRQDGSGGGQTFKGVSTRSLSRTFLLKGGTMDSGGKTARFANKKRSFRPNFTKKQGGGARTEKTAAGTGFRDLSRRTLKTSFPRREIANGGHR